MRLTQVVVARDRGFGGDWWRRSTSYSRDCNDLRLRIGIGEGLVDSGRRVSSCGERFDDLLDRFVSPVICDFEAAVWAMLRIRAMMEAAVGDGSAQSFMEA